MERIILFLGTLILLAVSTCPAQAQRTYITRKGKLVAKTLDGDSLKTREFKNINVLLDYDKAEVIINFKLDDTLDDHIPSNRFFYNYDVALNTRLSLSEIETSSHPTRVFDLKGELLYNETAYYIKGNGVLEHWEGSEDMSCMLTMNIELMDNTKLFLGSFGWLEEIHLFQTVLNREVLDEWENAGY